MKPSLTCPGTLVCCPTCGNPISRGSFHGGYGFHVCDRKRGKGPTRRNCDQHFFWHCTNRLCTVIAVTKEEHERFDAYHPTAEEILRELGVDVAREAA